MSQTGGCLLGAACLVVAALLAGCERTDHVQHGYRGTAEVQLYKPSAVAALADINTIPEAEEPADPDSPSVKEVFKNVQVMSDLSATEFSRLMQALATWVAPEEGCDYCHNPKKLESDEKYTKIVARRMLQMTRNINTNWKAHVGSTGVTAGPATVARPCPRATGSRRRHPTRPATRRPICRARTGLPKSAATRPCPMTRCRRS
jgi:photosynthetic reaction center cytochrome c subunit